MVCCVNVTLLQHPSASGGQRSVPAAEQRPWKFSGCLFAEQIELSGVFLSIVVCFVLGVFCCSLHHPAAHFICFVFFLSKVKIHFSSAEVYSVFLSL